ncbi:MAG TPA: energy transducer TonB [Terracidiphilus sp.]|jgi:TonB family protein|nr:energy transducer TonB [Terracidiphilus sp.]
MDHRTECKTWQERVRAGCGKAVVLAALLGLALPCFAADMRAVKLRVPPVYPELARRMKITGEVKLLATVDAQGNVTDVKATTGNRALAVAAEESVRKWKFVPGSGVSQVEVTVTFAISE